MTIPDPKYFLLSKANASSFQVITSALQSHDSQYFNFTPVQVQRPASHDSSLFMVKSFVTDAQLNADADLSALRDVNFSNEKCRLKFSSLDNFRIRGFHVLGESEKGTGMEEGGMAGRNHYYIRQKVRGSAGGWDSATGGSGYVDPPGYGDETGLTHYDALNCYKGTTWASGNTYSLCGALVRDRVENPTSANNTEGITAFPSGNYMDNPIIVRCDYEYDKGMHCGTLQDHNVDGVGGYRRWERASAATSQNVWRRRGGATGNQAGFYVNVTANTSATMNQHILSTVSATADVFGRDWSMWYDSTNNHTYLNIANGDDPHRKVGFDIPGGGWAYTGTMRINGSAANRIYGVHVINGNFVKTSFSGGALPKGSFMGGRYLWGSNFFIESVASGTTWGWSDDGEIPFDTSDRPDSTTDEYILKAIDRGSDATTWAEKMPRFVEINGAAVGIYEFGGWPTSADGVTIRGLLGQNVGNWVSTDKRYTFTNIDGHIIANQGGSNWQTTFFYLRPLPVAASAVKYPFNYYATTDGAGAQDIKDTLISDFVIASGALVLDGDAGAYIRSGAGERAQGIYDNNIIRRGCIADVSASGSTFNGVDAGGAAIAINQEGSSPHLMQDVYFLRDDLIADGQRNGDASTGAGGVTNPGHGRLLGDRWRFERCVFDNWATRVIHQREVNWHKTPVQVSAISNSNPCIVSAPASIIGSAGAIQTLPQIYFRRASAGMTEIEHQIYQAQRINGGSFMLLQNDTTVDSTGFGTFVSAEYGRAQGGYVQMVSCTYVKTGFTSADTAHKYINTFAQSISAMQTYASGGSNERKDLPGAAFNSFEVMSSIVAS